MSELAERYDVVCVGGALMGSSSAYFLTENPDFGGTVLVVEADPTYERASSSLAGNSIREQFSTPVNIRASRFGMEFFENFSERVAVDGEAPDLDFRGTGYLFLADDDGWPTLQASHEVQRREECDACLLDPDEVGRRFPHLRTEGLAGASLGSRREGSFEGWALLQGLRRRAAHNGATYVRDRVVAIETAGGRVTHVRLESGRSVACGTVVNTAGPSAALVSAMVGLELPVEPRRRMTFVFACRTPIEGILPLTITPEGVHFRREREHFATGCTPPADPAVAPDDLTRHDEEFEDHVWPVLARWVPQFDRVSVVASWAGHYAVNTLDHNMVIGPAPALPNFIFANGFSGHGQQQSPAVGRAVSELITYGGYRTLDMGELGYERIVRNEPFRELNVI